MNWLNRNDAATAVNLQVSARPQAGPIHQARRAWSTLSRTAGEGAERSEAGEGAAPVIFWLYITVNSSLSPAATVQDFS